MKLMRIGQIGVRRLRSLPAVQYPLHARFEGKPAGSRHRDVPAPGQRQTDAPMGRDHRHAPRILTVHQQYDRSDRPANQ